MLEREGLQGGRLSFSAEGSVGLFPGFKEESGGGGGTLGTGLLRGFVIKATFDTIELTK